MLLLPRCLSHVSKCLSYPRQSCLPPTINRDKRKSESMGLWSIWDNGSLCHAARSRLTSSLWNVGCNRSQSFSVQCRCCAFGFLSPRRSKAPSVLDCISETRFVDCAHIVNPEQVIICKSIFSKESNSLPSEANSLPYPNSWETRIQRFRVKVFHGLRLEVNICVRLLTQYGPGTWSISVDQPLLIKLSKKPALSPEIFYVMFAESAGICDNKLISTNYIDSIDRDYTLVCSSIIDVS